MLNTLQYCSNKNLKLERFLRLIIEIFYLNDLEFNNFTFKFKNQMPYSMRF